MTEVQLLRGSVASLKKQRDEWVAKHKECTRLLGEAMQDRADMAVERDAYAKCADDMAASHKVERDELATTLAAIEIKVDALIVERREISEGWNTANKMALQNALERDAYAKCADDYANDADTMAAAHKVERDELNAQISDALGQISHLDKEVAGWRAAQKENLKNQCELFGQIQQALVDRDALKDAAKLALDALDDLRGIRMNEVEYLSVLRAIAALKAVL